MSQNPRVPRAVYRHSCPNCGGPNTEERLALGLPCRFCLPAPPREKASILEIERLLREAGTLSGYKELARLERESRELLRFFERLIGSPAWGAQRTWARRLVRGDSFSIVAPTGVGKTTFGLAAALFFACRRGEKSYIILPTTTLVIQAEKKALGMMARANCNTRLIAIHSKMPRKHRMELLERVRQGDFTVLITTAAFARSKVELLRGFKYRMVFVDDVDAVLKSAKSVNVILRIAGFTDEDMELGMQLLRLQRRRALLIARLQRLTAAGGREELASQIRRELDKLEKELESVSNRIARARRRAASLIVSTATGRPRGSRVRLFRALLNFEAGGRTAWGLRNVYDLYTYPRDGVYERVVEIASDPRFRRGGLVFVPIDHGIEGAERLASMLRDAGVRAEAYHSKKPPSILEAFAAGEIEVLVGIANYYGTLVRGLDLPETVRYALFAGVPRHKFSADIGEPHPSRLLRLLALLVEVPIEDVAEPARRYMVRLRDIIRRLSPAALHMIAEKVLSGDVDEPGSPTWIVAEAYNFLRRAMEDEEVWDHLQKRRDVAVIVEEGKRYLLIADVPTYIQASGRTSRLYAGGLTLGVSVVVVDDERVFNGLVRRSRFYVETEWRRLEEVDIDDIMRRVDEDREKVRRLRAGKVQVRDLVRTALLIVESPNKARTIAGFFGQPSIRILPNNTRVYEVTTGDLILSIIASGGHVYDLAPRAGGRDLETAGLDGATDVFAVTVTRGNGARRFTPVYTSIKRCLDCGYQFTADLDRCPVCGSPRIRDSRGTVEDIRRVAWEVDTVLIGTDPDMEGEKIGWDVAQLVRPYARSLRRVEFHEITKKAILEAIRNPRDFYMRLVDAQVVRRVEDRWIGYTLSPLLWCHFWPRYYCPRVVQLPIRRGAGFQANERERCQRTRYYYNLSAGRVQTPVLGWVVDRTRKSRVKVYALTLEGAHEGVPFAISVREEELRGDKSVIRDLKRSGVKDRRTGRTVIEELEVLFTVLERREETLPPPPPYTTDTLLLDASRYLRMDAPETMRLAQNLFEWGLITYHRTDSTRVSDKGIEVAREWIREAFPEIASQVFRPRTWGAGGAHEAIRPTRPIDADTLWNMINEGVLEIQGFTRDHLRLYDLIFRRFMASQMREAVVERTRYRIDIVPDTLWAEVEGPTRLGRPGDPASKGFTLVWPYIRLLPRLDRGYVTVRLVIAKVSVVPNYTTGELVQEMKNRGIGRPSTYAKIVETLLRRRYITVVETRRDRRVVSTIRGEMVYNYLSRDIASPDILEDFNALSERAVETLRNVPRLVSEERTRFLEKRMVEIEEGVAERDSVLNEIYDELEGLAIPISSLAQNPDLAREWGLPSLSECLRNSIAVRAGREGDGRNG